jgi:hypothetical protein
MHSPSLAGEIQEVITSGSGLTSLPHARAGTQFTCAVCAKSRQGELPNSHGTANWRLAEILVDFALVLRAGQVDKFGEAAVEAPLELGERD